SPEQAVGDRDTDARTDIYSLGCVLYEMLAGEAPFTGPNARAVITRVVSETARPLTVVRETVSRQLAGAVERPMAKSPADRPASAAEFALTLESPLSVPALPAAAPRRPWWIPAGLAAAVAVVAAVGALLLSKRDADAGVPRIAVLPFENAGNADDEYF